MYQIRLNGRYVFSSPNLNLLNQVKLRYYPSGEITFNKFILTSPCSVITPPQNDIVFWIDSAIITSDYSQPISGLDLTNTYNVDVFNSPLPIEDNCKVIRYDGIDEFSSSNFGFPQLNAPNWTFNFWYRPLVAGGSGLFARKGIIAFTTGTNFAQSILIFSRDEQQLWIYFENSWIITGIPAPNGIWQNVTMVRNGSTRITYVNGVQVNSRGYGNEHSGATLYIGRGFLGFLNQDIPIVQAWHRAMNATEVSNLHNLYKNRFDL